MKSVEEILASPIFKTLHMVYKRGKRLRPLYKTVVHIKEPCLTKSQFAQELENYEDHIGRWYMRSKMSWDYQFEDVALIRCAFELNQVREQKAFSLFDLLDVANGYLEQEGTHGI